MHTSPWHWSIILTLLLLLLRGQTLLAAERANGQAVGAVSFCIEERPPTSIASIDATRPWFAAVQARCQGDAAREQMAWQQVIAKSPARLNAVRIAAPVNAELAQLAVERHPEVAVAHFWLGDALQEEGDEPAAITAYEAGLQLAPTSALVWDRLGLLYEDIGDLDKALGAYDLACYYVDRGRNGCLRAGRLYLEMGMYEEAVVRYRTSLQQLPDYPRAHRGLAEALLALGQMEEALPYLRVLADQGDERAQQTLRKLTQ